MKYYRVKQEYGNWCLYRDDGQHYIPINRFLVGGELITPTEYNKIFKENVVARYGNYFTKRGAKITDMFETVEISRKQTYWFFGARFA